MSEIHLAIFHLPQVTCGNIDRITSIQSNKVFSVLVQYLWQSLDEYRFLGDFQFILLQLHSNLSYSDLWDTGNSLYRAKFSEF